MSTKSPKLDRTFNIVNGGGVTLTNGTQIMSNAHHYHCMNPEIGRLALLFGNVHVASAHLTTIYTSLEVCIYILEIDSQINVLIQIQLNYIWKYACILYVITDCTSTNVIKYKFMITSEKMQMFLILFFFGLHVNRRFSWGRSNFL